MIPFAEHFKDILCGSVLLRARDSEAFGSKPISKESKNSINMPNNSDQKLHEFVQFHHAACHEENERACVAGHCRGADDPDGERLSGIAGDVYMVGLIARQNILDFFARPMVCHVFVCMVTVGG